MEFNPEEKIQVNLPNTAFHNLSKEIQDEMVNLKYICPLECKTNEEQYRFLAALREMALEAERKIAQVTKIVQRCGGTPRGSKPAAAFLSMLNEDDQGMEELQPHWEEHELDLTTNEDVEQPTEVEGIEELVDEVIHVRAMLSIAERAMRKASGEVVPLECWGCKGLPEYENDKFHRYRVCPHRKADPRVRANFEKNLRTWRENLPKDRKDPRNDNGKRNQGDNPRAMITVEEAPTAPNDELILKEKFGISNEGRKKCKVQVCKGASSQSTNVTESTQTSNKATSRSPSP